VQVNQSAAMLHADDGVTGNAHNCGYLQGRHILSPTRRATPHRRIHCIPDKLPASSLPLPATPNPDRLRCGMMHGSTWPFVSA